MSDEVKVIIAGSRDFDEWDFLTSCCYSVLVPHYEAHDLEFVSGGAKGADKMGEDFAESHWHQKATVMKPDYKNDPVKLAPLRRNRKMAEYSAGGILIAFLYKEVNYGERGGGTWAVKGGTSNMIMNAISNGMEVHIFRFPGDD